MLARATAPVLALPHDDPAAIEARQKEEEEANDQ